MKTIKMMKLKVLITLIIMLSFLALPAIGGEWGSGIKQIQRGTITIGADSTSNTATLSPAVVTSKTELRYLGNKAEVSGDERKTQVGVTLTNTTTVTATRESSGTYAASVSWEITEHY